MVSYINFLANGIDDFHKLDEKSKQDWLTLKQTYCESIGLKCADCKNTACYGHKDYNLNKPAIN
mgnify:CR=1 FL=1